MEGAYESRGKLTVCVSIGVTMILVAALMSYQGLHWRVVLPVVFPVVAGSFLAALWIAVAETHPNPGDLRRLDSHTVYYPTASFSLPPTVVLLTIIVPVLVGVAMPAGGLPLVACLFLLICTLFAMNYVLLPLLGFGAVWAFRVGRRLYLVSLGYCEGEVISDPGVEVELSGFRTLAEFPAESEYHGRLRMRVGYFPPGVYRVELPEGFLFLRTRGACVLRDPSLPEDDNTAFRTARYWEKFSMVYAALCLEEGGVPDLERIQETMRQVKNNSRKRLTVRYFGVTIPVESFICNRDTDSFLTPLSLIIAGILISVRKDWFTETFFLWSVLFHPLVCALVAWPVARRNKRAVTSGRWYRMITRRHNVMAVVRRIHGITGDNWFPSLRKIFDPLELEE